MYCLSVVFVLRCLAIRTKSLLFIFLQEKLADINDHLKINLLRFIGHIIFIHLISSFWSGGGIVLSCIIIHNFVGS